MHGYNSVYLLFIYFSVLIIIMGNTNTCYQCKRPKKTFKRLCYKCFTGEKTVTAVNMKAKYEMKN